MNKFYCEDNYLVMATLFSICITQINCFFLENWSFIHLLIDDSTDVTHYSYKIRLLQLKIPRKLVITQKRPFYRLI